MTQAEVFRKNWNTLRTKLRLNWMSLKDSDIATIDGSSDVLIELLREKYGYSQMQAQSQLETFLEENGAATQHHPS